MDFIVIFGPPAVGKMAVGYEIEKITGIPLFHNHMAIEPALRYFEFGTKSFNLVVDNYRKNVLNEVSKGQSLGLCYTIVWDLESDDDREFIEEICKPFQESNANIHFVELEASLNCRLYRNKTELRLSEKPSKRNLPESDKRLLSWEGKYKLNTTGPLPLPFKHIKVNSTDLTVGETASKIIRELGLEKITCHSSRYAQ